MPAFMYGVDALSACGAVGFRIRRTVYSWVPVSMYAESCDADETRYWLEPSNVAGVEPSTAVPAVGLTPLVVRLWLPLVPRLAVPTHGAPP